MRFRLLFILLPAMVSVSASAFTPLSAAGKHSIKSIVLGEERQYQIHVPDSYSWATDRRYPVLLVLDGQTHFDHTAASASFLAEQGEIPEMIVVAITSTVRVRDFTQTDWSSHWIGGGGAGNFKRFLSTELFPEIDRTYRTNGFRVLSGHSAGGQFVLYCLTSEPSLFQAYIALSPSLDWDDNLPQRSLERAFESTRALRSFLYVARSDDFGRALADYEKLVGTLRTKSPSGFRWYSQAFPEETHASIPLLGQIDALRKLYVGYRFHNDSLEKGLSFAEEHFKNVSKTVGWPLPLPEGVINGLGYSELSRGKIREALALFERNVQENPNSANAYDALSDGYAEAGRRREASRASDRALALATEFNNPNLSYFAEQAKKRAAQLKQEPEDRR